MFVCRLWQHSGWSPNFSSGRGLRPERRADGTLCAAGDHARSSRGSGRGACFSCSSAAKGFAVGDAEDRRR